MKSILGNIGKSKFNSGLNYSQDENIDPKPVKTVKKGPIVKTPKKKIKHIKKKSNKDLEVVVEDGLKSIVLYDLHIKDSKGNNIEGPYSKVYIDADFNNEYGIKNTLPYWAMVEGKPGKHYAGWNSPSAPLMFNILDRIFSSQSNLKEVDNLLNFYKNNKQVLNTIVNWNKSKIIHYPTKEDIIEHGGLADINISKKRYELNIKSEDLSYEIDWIPYRRNLKLHEGLLKEGYSNYLKDLTGLNDLSFLEELSKYLGMELSLDFPNTPRSTFYVASTSIGLKRHGLLGIKKYFSVDTDQNLSYCNALLKVKVK